jgi:DNA repair ATPase RecN
LKVNLEVSIQSDGPEDSKIFEKILDIFPDRINRQLESIHSDIHKIKELLMAIKEDFAQFVSDVNAKTNEIGASLTEIKADIERLIESNATTPPEVVAGMEEVKAKLAALAEASTAIAALDNPVVVPPPPEEPPVEPL